MALSYGMCRYWHEGVGARIVSVTASVLTILLASMGLGMSPVIAGLGPEF